MTAVVSASINEINVKKEADLKDKSITILKL